MRKGMLISILVSIFLLGACGKKVTPKTTSTNKDEVVIGVDDTFVPMGFLNEEDELVGLDIDLAKAVFKNQGKQVRFQQIDWSMKESELKNGTIDAIWNGYSVTKEREKIVDFSTSYLENKQIILVPKTSEAKDIVDLKGAKLGAQEGSSGASVLEENPTLLQDNIANQKAVLYGSFNEALVDLKVKRIDALLIDEVYANYYLGKRKDGKEFKKITTPFTKETFAVGVKKGNQELLTTINEGLKQLQENGELQKIKEKWLK